MTQTDSSANFYALLIGINFYFPNRLFDNSEYENLDGAVNDINDVEQFLLQQPKKPDKIYKLTATSAKRTTFLDPPKPIEAAADLPTYANIIQSFDEITKQAKAGDKVYIHYSGHGGRAKSIYPKNIKSNGIDETLVPTDIGLKEGQYIRDLELAVLLKRMVDKGLIVTLVLDSCHSGGSTRGKAKIRGLKDVIDETPRLKESLVNPSDAELNAVAPNQQNLKYATRGGTPVATMIPEAKGYVLLAACRPSESAYEDTFNDDKSNGALTYWLLDTLKQPFPGITYKMIHDRISDKINTQFATQNPMLLGEGDRIFLGTDYNTTPFAVTITEVKNEANQNKIKLDVGQAQGLRKGAEFVIYPLGTANFNDSSQRLAVAKITQRGATQSWGEVTTLIKPEPAIEVGSQAVLTAVPVKLLKKVRLLRDKDTPVGREAALQAIDAAIQNNGWVRLITTITETADYLVDVTTLDNEIVYQICDRAGEPILLRPEIKTNEPEAAAKIVKRLIHLAKYKVVEELDNHDFNSQLKGKIAIEVLGKMDDYEPGDPYEAEPFSDLNNIVMNVGEYLFLKIRNNSATTLNFIVLDLEHNWAIRQIEPDENTSSLYTPLDPQEDKLIGIKMGLPEGEKTGSDIFKVFATKDAANFRWLSLPFLDKPFLTPTEKGIVKTRSSQTNALGQMLAYFAEDNPDLKKNVTRTGNPVAFPSNDWTTVSLKINLRKS